MIGSQPVKDAAQDWPVLPDPGQGQRRFDRERAIQVKPPARLRPLLLEPPAGRGAVGEPDSRCPGDVTGCAGPGGDGALVQVIVEDHVTGLDPPDQRETRSSAAAARAGVPLRAVQVHADVSPVCDLQPESLPGITRPPGVDLACLVRSVGGERVGQPDARW